MRVNDKNLISDLRNYIEDLRNIGGRTKAPAQQGRVEAGRDRAHISRRAKEAEQARKAIEATPDVDEKRVKELKKAVEQGTYNVRGEVVAESMIRRSLIDALL